MLFYESFSIYQTRFSKIGKNRNLTGDDTDDTSICINTIQKKEIWYFSVFVQVLFDKLAASSSYFPTSGGGIFSSKYQMALF